MEVIGHAVPLSGLNVRRYAACAATAWYIYWNREAAIHPSPIPRVLVFGHGDDLVYLG